MARIVPWTALAATAALVTVALVAPHLTAACGRGQDGAAALDEDLAEWIEDILVEVEALRGLEFVHEVPFERIDHDGVDAFLTREIAQQGGPEALAFATGVLRLTGLFTPEQDYEELLRGMLRDQLAGLYDPRTKRFFLASGLHPALVRTTLAHELVHALDDQHYDLGAAMAERLVDSDRLWAYSALAEGSATIVHTRWMEANLGTFDTDDWAELSRQGQKGLDTAPEALWRPFIGAYLCGAAFLVRSTDALAAQLGQPRPGDVDRAFASPPESSEQVLHPAKYWDEAERDVPSKVELALGALPDGWRIAGEDTFGEIGLALATQRPDAKPRFDAFSLARLRHTNAAATGWDGDRHVLLEREGGLVLVAELVFDTARDAEECVAALAELSAWRLERLAALSAALGAPDEALIDVPAHEARAYGEVVTPSADAPRVRWLLFAGALPAEADRLAALVEATVTAR